ncbi:MAG TPA: type II CAAX endopeptidase family protein [Chitinophagales bacterium]|nr:type II CAAX endopeptidase family protein [Chitinophagales bacterium]
MAQIYDFCRPMNRRPYLMDNMHPAVQLFFLIMLCFVFFSALYFFSMYLVRPLFGITWMDEVMQNAVSKPEMVAMNANQVNALKFLQFTQTLGLFLIPALLFAKLKFPEGDYLRLNAKTNFLFVLLGILILVTASPIIDFTYYLNQRLEFPSFLSRLEKAVNDAEHANAQFTFLFIKTPRPTDLWINLIVIALVPAISEEVFFRGCLQQVFKEWTKNIHWAVWLGGAVFSFAHFEFYGFVPRMLLGALLGYLFVWSGSLWMPIIVHAFNNGAQIVLSYLHEHGKIQYDIASNQMESVWVTIIATVICIGLLWLYRKMMMERRFIY